MTVYLSSLNNQQRANMAAVIAEMKRVGITNTHTQASILSVISKESNFVWQAERSYATTSNAQIRKIFTQFNSVSDSKLNALKANDVAFFNAVYGGKYGNSATEGYKFRGRGPNQLTFKSNYASIGKRLGIDLVNNPDLIIKDPKIAAKVVVDFFVREFATGEKTGKLKQFNATNINSFTNVSDSLNAVFQANRGWNKTGPDTTGGYDKAKSRVSEFQQIVQNVEHFAPYFLVAGLAILFSAAYFFRADIREKFFPNQI